MSFKTFVCTVASGGTCVNTAVPSFYVNWGLSGHLTKLAGWTDKEQSSPTLCGKQLSKYSVI